MNDLFQYLLSCYYALKWTILLIVLGNSPAIMHLIICRVYQFKSEVRNIWLFNEFNLDFYHGGSEHDGVLSNKAAPRHSSRWDDLLGGVVLHSGVHHV